MQFFALETDINKLKAKFLYEGEQELVLIRYHALKFFIAIVREVLVTLVLIAIGIGIGFAGWPSMNAASGLLVLAWFAFVFFPLLRAFIDWRYDFILVTSDKVLFVDQTSVFRQEVQPIHMENVGGVSAKTQFWNVFPFGELVVQLRISGDRVIRRYVPNVQGVAGTILGALTRYQRQRNIYGSGSGTQEA